MRDLPFEYEILVTTRRGHAREMADALRDKQVKLISVGGDGTINEVLNGINGSKSVALGVLPVGSGNDFARQLHIYRSTDNILNNLLHSGTIRPIDFGRTKLTTSSGEVIHRSFACSCGIGFDAYVAYLSNKNKKFTGLLLYLVSVFEALKSYDNFNTKAVIDGRELESANLLLAIGNGKTSGGGFKLTPRSEMDDGLLDICLVDALTRRQIFTKLPLAVKGKHLPLKEASYVNFTQASLQFDRPVFVHLDGEVIDDVTSAEISIVKDGINVIYPK